MVSTYLTYGLLINLNIIQDDFIIAFY